MASKLKLHISQKIIDAMGRIITIGTFNSSILSSHLLMRNTKNGQDIEFQLALKSLIQSATANNMINKIHNIFKMFLPELKVLFRDDNTVVDVYEDVYKSNTNLVFKLDRNIFVKEILDDFSTNRPIANILCNSVPQSGHNLVVEYSSPNIAKPFHVGHLRSTIIGNFLSNLHEFLLHKVVRINYLGDWGTQFGLLKVGVELSNYTEDMIKQNPIKLLYEAYVMANNAMEANPAIGIRAREIFQLMEEGRLEDMEKWEMFRGYTVHELQGIYKRLGITFDAYNWESMYGVKDIKTVLNVLEDKGLLKAEEDGRKSVEINESRRLPLVKSDGTSLYLTRDIAAAVDRHQKYNFDSMLYVVDNAQTDHFTALFGTLSKMELPWAYKLKHVKFGRVRGMSTRRGNVVFLKDILDETRDLMKTRQLHSLTTKIGLDDLSDTTADVLGVSAIIINDLKQRRQRDYEFDWNKALKVNGDGGVRMQYTHCRLCSLESNSGSTIASECDALVLQEPIVTLLVQEIARFEEVLMMSYVEFESCMLVNYLFQLCNLINRALKDLQIKNQDEHIGSQRLLLFHASRQVLQQGMKILGLQPLTKM